MSNRLKTSSETVVAGEIVKRETNDGATFNLKPANPGREAIYAANPRRAIRRFNVLVKKAAARAEEQRTFLRNRYGDRYDLKLAPFRSLVLMQSKRDGQGAFTALKLIALVKGSPKLETKLRPIKQHLQPIFISAALDLIERKESE